MGQTDLLWYRFSQHGHKAPSKASKARKGQHATRDDYHSYNTGAQLARSKQQEAARRNVCSQNQSAGSTLPSDLAHLPNFHDGTLGPHGRVQHEAHGRLPHRSPADWGAEGPPEHRHAHHRLGDVLQARGAEPADWGQFQRKALSSSQGPQDGR